MKPSLRKIGTLTQEIVEKSPAWAFIIKPGKAMHVVTSAWVHAYNYVDYIQIDSEENEDIWIRYDRALPILCYPCVLDTVTGAADATPWPIAEGEEEIAEWESIDHSFYARAVAEWGKARWRLYNEAGTETGFEELIPRPGHRPAPRTGKDGKTVWVWEVCNRQ